MNILKKKKKKVFLFNVFFLYTQRPYSCQAITAFPLAFAFNVLPHHWGCISSVSERDLADLYSRTRKEVIQFSLRVARRELPIKEHAAKHPIAIHPEIRGGENVI